MKRINCPFCNKPVLTDKEGKIINGRGVYKTTILYHLECYEKYHDDHGLKNTLKELYNENK